MRWLIAVAFLVELAGIGAQTPSRTSAEIAALGPQVGARVPDFSLLDQNGRPRTLQSVSGPNGVLLVFFRSADW